MTMGELSPELRRRVNRVVESGKVPSHIAFIMDGNRRWAERNNFSLEKGHREGASATRDIAEFSTKIDGLEHLTFYAFSTENWSRPDSEVETLFNLLDDFLESQLSRLQDREIRFNTIGNLDGLPDFLQDRLIKAREQTAGNEGLGVNLALNYGSRDELVRTVRKLVRKIQNGELKPEQITEEIFAGFLDTADIPDPDLLIRTSGEKRISNFLLWQLAYTEFHFTERLWPEFAADDLLEAIRDFQDRERRFGSRTEE